MSLYLKYRPHDFDNLVGQEFINVTLKKAIADDKTVGAYLFCGPRGTGKTSTARILAKTINCPDKKGGNPCLKCSVCKDFLEERLIDIIEIDAASHTGVDNIREIIEKAQFRPSSLKYKVYIIDEVHMLSTGAFNALLKILEEPPEYVKFILATTETHKVPETIISRCQKYDFKRISIDDIKSRLSYIAKSEKVKIDEKSLGYIANNSGGGLRNAISLFEQLITDGVIEYGQVVEKLGIVKDEVLQGFASKLEASDSSIIDDFESLVSDGKNVKLFFKELIFFIKDSILDEIKAGNNYSKKLQILEILNETYSKTKQTLDENTTLLIGVLKIVNPPQSFRQLPSQVTEEQDMTQEKNKNSSLQAKGSTGSEAQGDGMKKQETINNEDVSNIFGETQAVSVFNTAEGKEDGSGFDTPGFIDLLKKHGAKASLLMGVRGAKVIRNSEHLDITFATEFAKKSNNTAENLGIIELALEEMSLVGLKINFK